MTRLARWISLIAIAAMLGGVDVPTALAAPEGAEAGGWQVLEKHGQVRYRPVGERYWWSARTGAEIPGGSSVAVDGNGFLIIVRGGESITVHPHSRLELPGGQSSDQVKQVAGDLRYRITRAPDRRFAIETPYLSLLVKGTVFDVAVGGSGAEVEVTEGRVRVDTPSGQVVELAPGHAARVAAVEGSALEVRSGPEHAFAPAGFGRTGVAGPAQDLRDKRNAAFSKTTARANPPAGKGHGGGKGSKGGGSDNGNNGNDKGKGGDGNGKNGKGRGGGSGNGDNGSGNGGGKGSKGGGNGNNG